MPRCCFANLPERYAVLGGLVRILSPLPLAQRVDPELDSTRKTAQLEYLELAETIDPTAPG